MTIRLGIIESHTIIRYGLRELVSGHADIEVAAECTLASAAGQMIHAASPDVVTIAADLTDGNGMRLAKELRARHPDLGIVILAAREEDDLLFRALEAGVSAFLLGTAPVEEVIAAIRHAAVAALSFTASGLAAAISKRRTVQQQLSPREGQVLSLLSRGMSIPAIAQVMFISPSTAKTYVARLYEKLGAANRAQALMMAMHHGLVKWQPTAVVPGDLAQAAREAMAVRSAN
jgi:DNA-binding NarL/FixJ family response regulator